jgi:hypothetical protein
LRPDSGHVLNDFLYHVFKSLIVNDEVNVQDFRER